MIVSELLEEKEKKLLTVRVHRQELRCGFNHEDIITIPHRPVLCKGGCYDTVDVY